MIADRTTFCQQVRKKCDRMELADAGREGDRTVARNGLCANTGIIARQTFVRQAKRIAYCRAKKGADKSPL